MMGRLIFAASDCQFTHVHNTKEDQRDGILSGVAEGLARLLETTEVPGNIVVINPASLLSHRYPRVRSVSFVAIS